jgi:hypothetical protein
VEKTPADLLMTRFLQAAFPNSYFVVIKRHPAAVCLATQKMWKINMSPLHRLFEHWLRCHELFEADKKYLNRVYELTYEDYIENPAKYHEEIADFIGTRLPEARSDGKYQYVVRVGNQHVSPVSEDVLEEVKPTHNAKYLKRWSDLLTKSFFRKYYCYIAHTYEAKFNRYGYSLAGPFKDADEASLQSTISAATGFLYSLGADVYAFSRRAVARTKVFVLKSTKLIATTPGSAKTREPQRSSGGLQL